VQPRFFDFHGLLDRAAGRFILFDSPPEFVAQRPDDATARAASRPALRLTMSFCMATLSAAVWFLRARSSRDPLLR